MEKVVKEIKVGLAFKMILKLSTCIFVLFFVNFFLETRKTEIDF